MSKSILYRWFGLRKAPIETRTRLMNEGIVKLFYRATGQLTCYWRTENAAAILAHIRSLQERHAV